MDAVGVGQRVDAVRVRLPQGEVELDPLAAAVLRGLVENRGDVAVVGLPLLLRSVKQPNGKQSGQLVLNVPGEVARDLRKRHDRQGVYALVHIPYRVLEEWDRLIVTPATAAAQRGGLIVAP